MQVRSSFLILFYIRPLMKVMVLFKIEMHRNIDICHPCKKRSDFGHEMHLPNSPQAASIFPFLNKNFLLNGLLFHSLFPNYLDKRWGFLTALNYVKIPTCPAKLFFQLKICSHFRTITQSVVMLSAFLCSS